MRLFSNITCTFAILAQIFLSSIAFAHDVTCQASHQLDRSELKETPPHTHSCGCCHHHHEPTSQESTPNQPSTPEPCNCSSELPTDFIAGDYSVQSRTKKIAELSLMLFAESSSASFYSTHSLFSLSNNINAPPDIVSQPSIHSYILTLSRLRFLPEHSGRFVSTHLSLYLI